MKKENKRPKVVLSKLVAWIILVFLAILDSSLDMIFVNSSGLQSSFWKPIADFFGIKYAILGVPLLLIIFFIAVKIGAFLEKKIEKVQYAEELVLTTLVIVYGLFDLWLILVYFFKFTLIKNHLYLIPILIVIGAAYSWWAENKLKKIK
ncbi:MAG: hypothetical protein KKA65_03510 [Nanoarchaeota archaeon]|nr:hypothetical protein [Nanoarchaeota archaeon]MBU4242407.1 hypothetical protein [Nanoarchaeota archaeon]MBU4352757.1 hypothetical protein [Nanoarchaeota archaeon]MBU4456545.1 hypothetical protein [Nanoarchaeota archaeon]MCG2719260.1 hypothetical protein [Nanoarchaeota archaeon]